MIGPVSSCVFPCGEIPRYRKKSQKRPPKKADHKHEYEPVILSYIAEHGDFSKERGFIPMRSFCAGSRCTICGRLNHGFPDGKAVTVADVKKLPWPTGDKRFSQIRPEYRSLPVVKLSDYWTLKEEKE